MPNAIGTNVIDALSFNNELAAAGLNGLPFSFGADGSFNTAALTPAQAAAVMTVYAAHNPLKSALLAYAANARFIKETAGITVSGTPMPTDRVTQSQLAGAYAYVQANASATFQWKLANGAFTQLNATQITAIATAVAAHVQACFTMEATVAAAVKAGSITTNTQIDAQFATVTV